MPAAIWAAPMARVRLGRLARPRMSLRQGLGPWSQALASAWVDEGHDAVADQDHGGEVLCAGGVRDEHTR